MRVLDATRDEDGMSAIQSNADALLLAVPMAAVMFAWFFKLDELICRPKYRVKAGHSLSQWDCDGNPVCIEPDGTLYRTPGRGQGSESSPRRG